uniref:Uncharacterized protein n=1 Tax=Manihot esculenta TaxID=3983 RepID=A0A2C9VZZ6_MANES
MRIRSRKSINAFQIIFKLFTFTDNPNNIKTKRQITYSEFYFHYFYLQIQPIQSMFQLS